jgi:hypothetical protein
MQGGGALLAALQALTPQLLGLLQHRSAAVRALMQQLLQGLAVVVPRAVLYPLVVEVRSAQEAGLQVGLQAVMAVCLSGLRVARRTGE